ncbi:hypothetical protein [Burkholderia sp. AW49-1]
MAQSVAQEDDKMVEPSAMTGGSQEPVPESLPTLAEHLELALDSATSVLMMRHTTEVCTVYLGDPTSLPEDL